MFVNLDKYALDSKRNHEKNKKWQLKKITREFAKIGRPDLADGWIRHYLEDENPEIIMKEKESKKELINMGFREVKILKRLHMDALLIAKK